jgi:hypothetical protein
MRISAPFSIDVIKTEGGGDRELHLQFTQAFRAMPVDHRSVVFKKYVEDLDAMLLEMKDDSAEKAGMITVHQISSELLPHIVRDEIPLSETIVIDVTQDQDAVFDIFSKNEPVQ